MEKYHIRIILENTETGKIENVLEEETKNVCLFGETLDKRVMSFLSGLTNKDIIELMLSQPDMRTNVQIANAALVHKEESDLINQINRRKQ